MEAEIFNLDWHSYPDHLKQMMLDLMHSNKYTDVTLVCDDKTKFKAHKFVLNACSPIFKSIIDDLPQIEGSVVYLRGVFAPEMKSILEFMYLGQASLYQDRMDEFFNIAKSLEIKEISKYMEFEDSSHAQEKLEQIQSKKHYEDHKSVQDEVEHAETKISSFPNETGQFSCNKCEKLFSTLKHQRRHFKSAHEGIKYPCCKCNKTFTTKADLAIHIQSIHDGVKFQCNLCDAEYSQHRALLKHKKHKH